MATLRILAGALLAVILSGAETAWPDVPDPIGLGPRLALIDWLHERKVVVQAGATDQEIIELWRQASGVAAQEAKAEADRQDQLHQEQLRVERERRAEEDRLRSEAAVAAAQEAHRESHHAGAAAEVSPTPSTSTSTSARTDPSTPGRSHGPVQPADRPAQLDVRIDNISEWAENAVSAPSSTRSSTTVTLYVCKGDTANYYVLTKRRQDSEAARVLIDDIDYGLAKTGLKKIPARKQPISRSPSLLLVAP